MQIPFVVETFVKDPENPAVAAPVVGATVTVTKRPSSTPATVYGDETSNGVISSPVTDEFGRIPGWLEEGAYNITVTGGTPSIAAMTQAWDAVSAKGVAQVVDGSITFEDLVASVAFALVPTGSIFAYAGSSAPPSYLFADGASRAVATYPNLFAVCGYTFGGAGANFNVPDLRGSVLVGPDNFGSTGPAGRLSAQTFANGLVNSAVRGGRGGEQSSPIHITELTKHKHGVTEAAHTHGTSDPGHAHGVADSGHQHGPPPGSNGYFAWSAGSATGKGIAAAGGDQVFFPGSTTFSGVASTGIGIFPSGTGISILGASTALSTNNEGSGVTRNQMAPYVVAPYIIKY